MRNNLFEFWPTVVKTYLEEKEYRNDQNELDLILKGDLYSLPQTLKKEYSEDRGYDFFEDLFNSIYKKTASNPEWKLPKKEFDLSSVKLAEYHGEVYNSVHMYYKYVKPANFIVLKDYVKGTQQIKIKKPIIDRWKVGFYLMSLALTMGYLWLIKPMIKENDNSNNLQTENDSLKTINKGYLKDEFSPIYEQKDEKDLKDDLEGTWYSYNESNGSKYAENNLIAEMPFDKIKWKFEYNIKNGQIQIERKFGKKTSAVNTISKGIAHYIQERYYFNLNVFNGSKKIGTREFICEKRPNKKNPKEVEEKSKLLLECLCTLLNTEGNKVNSIIVSREILEKEDEKIGLYDRLGTDNITHDSLPVSIKPYFLKNIPSYLLMTKTDTSRLRLKIDSLKIAEIIKKRK